MSIKNNTYFNTFGSVTSDGNLLPNNNVLYGPYDSIDTAYTKIHSQLEDAIPIGLTVGIIIDNVIKEYWFSGGTTIEHLIPKIDSISHAESIYMSDGKTVENAINGKQETLVSGSNIKTINGVSVLGEGDISIPKGDKGDKGEKGDKGDKGEKGDQGNSGFQGDFMDFEVVNNLTDGGADKALSAEMGKELQSIISKSSGLFKNYGYYIGPNGLIIETSNPNAITDYIPLDSVDKIIICGRSSDYVSLYAFYDENKNFIASAYGNEYNNTAITINSSDFPANAKYFIGNGNGNDNDLLLGIGTNGHIITLINSLDNRTQSLEENRVSKYIIKTHPFDIGENDVCKGILDAYESNYDNSLVYYIRTYRADLDSQTRLIVTTKSKETGEIVTNYYLDTDTATILYEDGSYKIYKEGSFIIAINWALIPSTGTTWKQPNAVFSESISNINNGIYIKRYEYEDKVEQLDERLKPVEVTDKLLYLTEDLTSTQQSGYWNGNVVDSENPTFWINSDTLRTVTMDILLGDRIETNSNFSPTKSVPWCLLNKDNYIIQRLNNFNSLIVTEDMVNAGAVKISLCYRTTQMVDTFFVYRTRFVTYDLKNNIKELRNNIANIVPKFGKKVLLFGDSQIGQCRMESILSEMLNTDVYNFGFGGCRWTWRTPDGSNKWDAYVMVEVADALVTKNFTKMDSFTSDSEIPSYFANAVAQMKTLELGDGSEYIATISYGGNDYASGVSLGEVNSMDKTKLYGAINYAISTLLEAYPALTIHVVSPTYRVYEKDTDGSILVDSDEKVITIDGTQYKRYEYGDKILEHVRDYHRLPTYDMYRRGGRNRYNIYSICPDGTHPSSELGRKLTAEKYEKIIKSF